MAGKRIVKEEEKKERRTERRVVAYLFVFLILTAGCIVFEVLCLKNTQISWLIKNLPIYLCFAVLLTLGAFFVSVWFVLKDKELIVKSLISGYLFLLFALVVLFVLQKTGFFAVVKNEQAFQEYIQRAGAWMPFVYTLFQFLQVVILPVPSIVSTLAGVALFGAFKATVFSLIGIIAGSFVAFVIGRKLGNKAVSWLVGEDTLQKWQKKLKGKDNLVLTLMFFLPFFPDDVLCFVAGLSSMSIKYFIGMISISRVIAVASTCYSVDFIPFNTTWGLIVWGVFAVLVVCAFVFVYKNIDRIEDFLSKRFKTFRKRKERKDISKKD